MQFVAQKMFPRNSVQVSSFRHIGLQRSQRIDTRAGTLRGASRYPLPLSAMERCGHRDAQLLRGGGLRPAIALADCGDASPNEDGVNG